ncbi:MAG TPA: lysyl oxidase family protein [Solirubrobacteraceae bacterium]|jgi:hypothetical protein|nr:lysyl oxidase family protein [Solirubrobacteraceae bacterium]
MRPLTLRPKAKANLAFGGAVVAVIALIPSISPIASGDPTEPTQPRPCKLRPFRLRCPDLIMSAPSHLQFDRSTRPGRVLLRASSSINNRGGGPLELSGHRTGANEMAVYQAIYDRGGRRHLFKTAAKLTFKYIPGDRYGIGNVGAASYWKLEHAAGFELWSIDAHRRALRMVRRGPKVDYCLRDLVHSRPSRRSPSTVVYPACSQNRSITRDILGTSVGWSDAYPYEYPEQWIDVTGLRGRFAYVQIADPDERLMESNHHNDVSETYIALPSGRVLGYRVGVSSP